MGTFSQRASAKKALISRAYAKSRPQITGNFGLNREQCRMERQRSVSGARPKRRRGAASLAR